MAAAAGRKTDRAAQMAGAQHSARLPLRRARAECETGSRESSAPKASISSPDAASLSNAAPAVSAPDALAPAVAPPPEEMRIAPAAPGAPRRRPGAGLLVSLAVHAAALGAASWILTRAPDQLPSGGEEAIAIEMVIAGSAESDAAKEGALPDVAKLMPPPTAAEPLAPELRAAALPDSFDLPSPQMPALARELAAPPPMQLDIETPVATALDSELTAPPPMRLQLNLPPPEPLSRDLTPPAKQPAPAPPQLATPQKAKPAPVRRSVARQASARPETERARTASNRKQQPARGKGAAGDGDAATTSRANVAAGTGGESKSAGTAEIADYRARALAHLARYKRYPEAARDAGAQGRTIIAFVLSRSGSVISARLTGPSGNALLDQATLSMLQRAQPFPPMPAGGPTTMSFNTAIRYDLR